MSAGERSESFSEYFWDSDEEHDETFTRLFGIAPPRTATASATVAAINAPVMSGKSSFGAVTACVPQAAGPPKRVATAVQRIVSPGVASGPVTTTRRLPMTFATVVPKVLFSGVVAPPAPKAVHKPNVVRPVPVAKSLGSTIAVPTEPLPAPPVEQLPDPPVEPLPDPVAAPGPESSSDSTEKDSDSDVSEGEEDPWQQYKISPNIRPWPTWGSGVADVREYRSDRKRSSEGRILRHSMNQLDRIAKRASYFKVGLARNLSMRWEYYMMTSPGKWKPSVMFVVSTLPHRSGAAMQEAPFIQYAEAYGEKSINLHRRDLGGEGPRHSESVPYHVYIVASS